MLGGRNQRPRRPPGTLKYQQPMVSNTRSTRMPPITPISNVRPFSGPAFKVTAFNTEGLSAVKQWATFARKWWIYDANQQCPHKTSVRLRDYLQGKHKPIYHPLSDVGDHIVVFNTRHVAMEGENWRTITYSHHTKYGGGYSRTTAWKLHDMDPTKIVHKSMYSHLKGNLLRPNMMRRFHLYPDDDIPENILRNISEQIEQVMPIYKRLDQYTPQEITDFPKIFEWPDEYVKVPGERKLREDEE